MSRYIERVTGIEVDVTCIMSYRGEDIAAIVTMPDGYKYSLPMSRVHVHFDQVPNQTISLVTANPAGKYDRTETLLMPKKEPD